MQTENNNNVEQVEPKNKGVSIGALLVAARNSAAFNQADIAEQINLPVSIIKALEEDDFDMLPEPTYVRGYLRNYSRAVGIDETGILKVYNEQYYQAPNVEVTRRSNQSYDPAILWSTAAVLSILVGLVITWWSDNHQVPEQAIELVSNQVSVDQNNSADSAALNDQSSIGDIQENNESENASAEQESAPLSDVGHQIVSDDSTAEVITEDTQQAMEEESKNPNLISSIDGAQVITVTYTEKSWTEIRDADSNTLMQGLIEPGVVRNLSGKPPFEIFLGNAPGVVIEVNGLYFDHSQYSRSNRTARFQVSSGSLN